MILKKPLVSIVITYFNKRKFIDKTLKSIFNQTYKNYELIFVYDDTNKKDLILIKKLLQKFKRKKLFINKYNLGVAKSRNKALRHCSGEYVAFIDSDDIWKKIKLSKQINFMVKNSLFSPELYLKPGSTFLNVLPAFSYTDCCIASLGRMA